MKNEQAAVPIHQQNEIIHRALAFYQSGRLDAAARQYKKLLGLQPDHAMALTSLGTIALQQGQSEQGISMLRRSLAIAPDQPEALNSIGNALQEANRLDEALASYDYAIALRPDFTEAWCNRGNVLRDSRRWDEAAASYERAIALNPGYAGVWWNKSLMKLINGDYKEGWRLYEWRWKIEKLTPYQKRYPQPPWLGEQSLNGKTLLIHPEQGLGDYLHFIRYAPLAEQRAAAVILEVPLALKALVSTLKGQFRLISKEQLPPDIDYHCPLMSLPLAFNTRLESIPAQIPYLFADKTKQAAWQQRLGKKSGCRVGLVWSGSTAHANDHNRSIALAQFAPLFELPAEFHSLQKEIRPADAQFMANCGRVKNHQALLHDFSDTAALIEEMDLVIAVDTAVAHLAGALGKKVWILLPYVADYRWMLDRKDTPWYPGATLFRQPTAGDWATVINSVSEALSGLWQRDYEP